MKLNELATEFPHDSVSSHINTHIHTSTVRESEELKSLMCYILDSGGRGRGELVLRVSLGVAEEEEASFMSSMSEASTRAKHPLPL